MGSDNERANDVFGDLCGCSVVRVLMRTEWRKERPFYVTRPSWQETLTKWKSRAISPLLRILKIITLKQQYGFPMRFTYCDLSEPN